MFCFQIIQTMIQNFPFADAYNFWLILPMFFFIYQRALKRPPLSYKVKRWETRIIHIRLIAISLLTNCHSPGSVSYAPISLPTVKMLQTTALIPRRVLLSSLNISQDAKKLSTATQEALKRRSLVGRVAVVTASTDG